jgi:hypothetical protein
MTVIDADFRLTKCIPILATRIGSRHLFTESLRLLFITFDVFFGEDDGA